MDAVITIGLVNLWVLCMLGLYITLRNMKKLEQIGLLEHREEVLKGELEDQKVEVYRLLKEREGLKKEAEDVKYVFVMKESDKIKEQVEREDIYLLYKKSEYGKYICNYIIQGDHVICWIMETMELVDMFPEGKKGCLKDIDKGCNGVAGDGSYFEWSKEYVDERPSDVDLGWFEDWLVDFSKDKVLMKTLKKEGILVGYGVKYGVLRKRGRNEVCIMMDGECVVKGRNDYEGYMRDELVEMMRVFLDGYGNVSDWVVDDVIMQKDGEGNVWQIDLYIGNDEREEEGNIYMYFSGCEMRLGFIIEDELIEEKVVCIGLEDVSFDFVLSWCESCVFNWSTDEAVVKRKEKKAREMMEYEDELDDERTVESESELLKSNMSELESLDEWAVFSGSEGEVEALGSETESEEEEEEDDSEGSEGSDNLELDNVSMEEESEEESEEEESEKRSRNRRRGRGSKGRGRG